MIRSLGFTVLMLAAAAVFAQDVEPAADAARMSDVGNKFENVIITGRRPESMTLKDGWTR